MIRSNMFKWIIDTLGLSKPPAPPFDVGQRVRCTITAYNHIKGEVYTVRSMFLGVDRKTWFIRLNEVTVSTSAEFFVAEVESR